MKEHVAEIIAAYLKKNRLDATELPALIASVGRSLAGLGRQAPAAAAAALTPAVPVRRSVSADAITCLNCGWSGKMLRRDLTTAHGLTADEYRTRWSLGADYPMVTKNYAARRSELAKAGGPGKRTK